MRFPACGFRTGDVAARGHKAGIGICGQKPGHEGVFPASGRTHDVDKSSPHTLFSENRPPGGRPAKNVC